MNTLKILNKRYLRSSEGGQSLVELALIITFLLILVAGLVDLGRMIFTYLTMRDAAQEGAVYGSIEPALCPGIYFRTKQNLPLYQEFGVQINGIEYNPDITPPLISCPTTNSCSGDVISVTVFSDFDIRMPLLGIITGDTVPLSATINDTVLKTCP